MYAIRSQNYFQCYIIMLFNIFISCILLSWINVNGGSTTNHRSVEKLQTNDEGENSESDPQWICFNETCTKQRRIGNDSKTSLSLETCRKICSSNPVWPKPKTLEFHSKTYSQFTKSNIQCNIEAPPKTFEMLNDFMDIFRSYLKENDTSSVGNILKLNIRVQNKKDIVKLELDTDESYYLSVSFGQNLNVTVVASTYFGARHGLESLSQLIWFDPILEGYQILHDVIIEDFPSFSYRGVMVDTARNFFPLYLLKKAVDGMSYSKLNVLHLHLTDAVSFPIVFEDLGWLSEGAYNPESTYTQKDIKDLTKYSLLRGVRVLLEIDAPSHVSAGWQSNPEHSDLVICDETDILNGHLNPDNGNTLNVLQGIYQNLLNLMSSDDVFHIGGDEVNLDCWRDTKASQNFSDMTEFWSEYTNLMIERLKVANENKLPKNIILWSSPLTGSYSGLNNLKYKKNMIVQFWFGYPDTFLRRNIRVIFSTVGHWYLDCGFGPWKPSQKNGVCDPYTPWQKFYTYRPWTNASTKNLTEGGEVCLWSEQVAEESLETRIWPRAAAFAERIWSDPPEFEEDVYIRLDNLREIMRSRGLQVSAIWPKWCTMNPGKC